MTGAPWYVQLMNAFTPLAIGVLGTGGIAALVKAIKDWRDGKAQVEADADARLMTRLEKRIEELEAERNLDQKWARMMVQALSRAGIEVPDRPE